MATLAQLKEQASKITPFYLEEDPVMVYLKALQRFLGVTATGAWNRTTHNALASFVNRFSRTLPAWGANPVNVADYVTAMVSDVDTEGDFEYIGDFFRLIGLPYSYDKYMDFLDDEATAQSVATALSKVADHVRKVEWGEIPAVEPTNGATTTASNGSTTSNGDTATTTATTSTAIVSSAASDVAIPEEKSNLLYWVLGGLVLVGLGYLIYRAFQKDEPVLDVAEGAATADMNGLYGLDFSPPKRSRKSRKSDCGCGG